MDLSEIPVGDPQLTGTDLRLSRRVAVLIELGSDGQATVIYTGSPAEMPVRWIHPETQHVVEWSAIECAEAGEPTDPDDGSDYECHGDG